MIKSNNKKSKLTDIKNDIYQLIKLDEWLININKNNIHKLFKRYIIKKNILENNYSKLKDNFKKFVPECLINSVSRWILEDIKIGSNTEKDVHIIFIDISGFTEISEKLEPQKALHLLNIYFDWIVEISQSNWWYIDKFLWDWVMLVFNDKASDNTIKTAIEIRDLVDKLNIVNFKNKINIWIWINSWKATLWTIWSKNRMDITIIWDTVNTASRIEKQTRIEKEWILFSEKTFNLINEKNKFQIENIWKRKLKWKEEKINLFWII